MTIMLPYNSRACCTVFAVEFVRTVAVAVVLIAATAAAAVALTLIPRHGWYMKKFAVTTLGEMALGGEDYINRGSTRISKEGHSSIQHERDGAKR